MIREISDELHSDAAYSIYSACMYHPTSLKYRAKVNSYLSCRENRRFGAFDNGTLIGILIIQSGEILGIAVRQDMRSKGIGRALIHHAARYFSTITAETDDDSVDFYRSCGFTCEKLERTFPDGICIRYKCTKNNF